MRSQEYLRHQRIVVPSRVARLTENFLKALDLQVISSDVGCMPREAIAVFRKTA